MKRLQFSLLIFFLLLFSSVRASEHTDPRVKLLLMLEKKEYLGAYDFAELHFDYWAGDTEYDYLYGIAASKINQKQRAIFAFERVILNEPSNIRARLALAVAYYELANYKAAEREFTQILLLAPDTQTAQKIKQYQSLMNEKALAQGQRLYGSLAFNVGHDTNVNSGLGNDQTELPFPGLGLLPVSFSIEEDQQWQVRAQLGYDLPLDQNKTLFFDLAASNVEYFEFNRYQKSSADIVFGLREVMVDRQYKVMGYIQPFWLGGEHYQDLAGVMLDYVWGLTDTTKLAVNFNLSQSDNKVDDNLSLQSFFGKLSYQSRIASSLHQTWFSLAAERVKHFNNLSQHNERDLAALGYRWAYVFPQIGMFSTDIEYQYSDHLNDDLRFLLDDVVFFERRHDNTVQVGLNFDYKVSEQWMWQTRLRYSDKSSNVVLYDYDKTLFTTGFQFHF